MFFFCIFIIDLKSSRENRETMGKKLNLTGTIMSSEL